VEFGLVLRIAASLVVAYLLGAIPWALIIGKSFYRVDVRTLGSGNLGATNVMRALGWKAALATFSLDVGKGAVAVFLAGLIVSSAQYGAMTREWTMIGAMLATMAGHTYSPYIGFKGGKGVATGFGALLILVPLACVVLFLTWLAAFLATRMVSFASVVVAVEYPLLMMLLYRGDWPLLAVSIIAAGLVIWRHRSNIRRIIAGEEPRISLTRDPSAQEKGRS
jgi:acyl phosphate:glycerol-3-phosphate acyltransferase